MPDSLHTNSEPNWTYGQRLRPVGRATASLQISLLSWLVRVFVLPWERRSCIGDPLGWHKEPLSCAHCGLVANVCTGKLGFVSIVASSCFRGSFISSFEPRITPAYFSRESVTRSLSLQTNWGPWQGRTMSSLGSERSPQSFRAWDSNGGLQ